MNVKRRAARLLKEISAASDAQQEEILSRMKTDSSSREAMEYLEAKGLVKLTHAYGGDIVFFRLLPVSAVYLQEQKDRVRERWTDRIIGFVIGVAAAVTANLLTGYAQSAVLSLSRLLQTLR